jgi:DNA-binding response OmpR family regulator
MRLMRWRIQCRDRGSIITPTPCFFPEKKTCSRRVKKDSHLDFPISPKARYTLNPVNPQERVMVKVALIEDDLPTSNQLKAWIEAAKPGTRIDQWFNRDDAEAAITRESYDLVVLDIELGRERHAGVAIINAINKHQATPVLVVSAMPATIYRSIMKALDAWDYLQKTTFEESDFIDTFLEMLRSIKERRNENNALNNRDNNAVTTQLSMDPLRQNSPTWRGQRINLPLTAQRILAALLAHSGQVVSYEDLFQVVKSGRNRDNVRKHVSTIREAFREIDPDFEGIENIPMRGFRWVDETTTSASGKK